MKQVYEMEVITRTRSVYGIVATSEAEAKEIAIDVDFFEAGTPRSRSRTDLSPVSSPESM